MELRPITPDNHLDARALSVHMEQRRFVATVDKSLADAYVWKDALFRVAYSKAEPVGYVLIFPFEDDAERLVNIVRLMIDARHQNRGLGRELLLTTFDWIQTLTPRVNTIRISTLPDNEIALHLYRSMGFTERGVEDGEIALYKSATEPDSQP